MVEILQTYAPEPQSNLGTLDVAFAGLPQALEIMENLENHKKSSMHGKIMEFEKTWIIMESFKIIWRNH